ncbi:hypothetical protein PhCBS80983_g01367 [Powellomyces hirtus]|uniref:FAD-binding FR-type domain-containing protein n=1 Tax=Powellomyces hirtus TaxID=109895 RepID=A0A507EB04_9FUNG|nr:hypothetical protein PhCBS80983_g01367 [Powellomyces hirtus]
MTQSTRRISPLQVSAVFAVLLPACLFLSASLLLEKGCVSMICPENHGLKDMAKMSIIAFYFWLAMLASLLALAQRTSWGHGHAWKHSHATLHFFGKISYPQILIWLLVLCHQLLQYMYWYNAYRSRSSAPGILPVLQAAYKAIGLNIGIQLSLTLLPTSRGGFLSTLFGIGYDSSLGFHRLSGILTVKLSIIHVALFAAFATLRSGSWESFWRITLMIGASPERMASYRGWLGPAGLVSLLLFIWVAVNSVNWVRRKHYCWFWINHFAVLLAILAAMVHASPMLWYSLPTLAFYIVDSCVRVYNRRRQYTITRLEVEECGYVRLDIGDCHVPASPGQWVSINIPAISKVEWHPFTVANCMPHPSRNGKNNINSNISKSVRTSSSSSSSETQYLLAPTPPPSSELPHLQQQKAGLSLIIKPAPSHASWTQQLVTTWQNLQQSQRQSDPESNIPAPLVIHIDGPHGTLPPRFLRSDTILIVVGGSGIPGGLAIAKSILNNALNSATSYASTITHPPKVLLYWTCRSPAAHDMTLWRELLAHPRAHALLEPHLCITTGKPDSPRLSVPAIIRHLKADHTKTRTVSVYACGPAALMDQVTTQVATLGDVVGDGFETTPQGPYLPPANEEDPMEDEPWAPNNSTPVVSPSNAEHSRRTRIRILMHVEGYGR